MYRKIEDYEGDDLIHVWNRVRNKEDFPLPLNEMWAIMGRHLYFMSFAFGLRIHAFVLMTNHYHMLLEDPLFNLSDGVGRFQKMCTEDVNIQSGRINQLWGGRFSRSLVRGEQNKRNVFKYVIRNPVDAYACNKVEDYPWSSLQFSLAQQTHLFPLYDEQVDLITKAEELSWLNGPFPQEDYEDIGMALRKGKFKLRRRKGRKNPLNNSMVLRGEVQKPSRHFLDV